MAAAQQPDDGGPASSPCCVGRSTILAGQASSRSPGKAPGGGINYHTTFGVPVLVRRVGAGERESNALNQHGHSISNPQCIGTI